MSAYFVPSDEEPAEVPDFNLEVLSNSRGWLEWVPELVLGIDDTDACLVPGWFHDIFRHRLLLGRMLLQHSYLHNGPFVDTSSGSLDLDRADPSIWSREHSSHSGERPQTSWCVGVGHRGPTPTFDGLFYFIYLFILFGHTTTSTTKQWPVTKIYYSVTYCRCCCCHGAAHSHNLPRDPKK